MKCPICDTEYTETQSMTGDIWYDCPDCKKTKEEIDVIYKEKVEDWIKPDKIKVGLKDYVVPNVNLYCGGFCCPCGESYYFDRDVKQPCKCGKTICFSSSTGQIWFE